jgi:protein-tyrosine phosphatase
MNLKNIKSITVVCAGNICRSPIGEVVLQQKLNESGLEIEVNSAGTGNWHEGENANAKSIKVLTEKGYEIKHVAKQFKKNWFIEKDLILVMDHQNKRDLESIAPIEHKSKIKYFREFDKNNLEDLVVPDPYYEPIDAFYEVLDMLEKASSGLVEELKKAQQ